MRTPVHSNHAIRGLLGAPAALAVLALAAPLAPRAEARLQDLGTVAEASANEPATWDERLGRDRLLQFTQRSAESALTELSRPDLLPERRPVALMALGCAGARNERARLESWAVDGPLPERQAAILALGELGLDDPTTLLRLSRSPQPELAGCALLALLRQGSPQAREAVQRVASDEANPLAGVARDLLVFALDASGSHESAPARRWLDLRWEAARRYGLVDGQAWSARLLDGLLADESFLDQVIYGCASELHRQGVADHFLELALAGGSPVRLRGVVNAIPTELDRLLAAGLWVPSDDREWSQLVFEIDERRIEALTVGILRSARLIPGLSAYASILLVRSGNQEGLPLLELDLASKDPLQRARIAEALGGTREEHYVQLLQPLEKDEDPRVRVSAWIARYRLGEIEASESLPRSLGDAASPDHAQLVEQLCRVISDSEIESLLLGHAAELEGEPLLRVATALTARGHLQFRVQLRDALRRNAVPPALQREVVRALASQATHEDLLLLSGMFPSEGPLELNIELARSLIRRHDLSVLPVLRAALWREPFNRSVLAGALVIEVAGTEALRSEVARPPRVATPRALRRVGFALGEWGGTDEVERLARRANAADPALQGAYLGAMGARTH
jgi:hypothetical protein